MPKKKRHLLRFDISKMFVFILLLICWLYFLIEACYMGAWLNHYNQESIVVYEGKVCVSEKRYHRNSKLEIVLSDGTLFQVPVERFQNRSFLENEQKAVFRYVKVGTGFWERSLPISIDSMDKGTVILSEQSTIKELHIGIVGYSVISISVLCFLILLILMCLPISVMRKIWMWFRKQIQTLKGLSRR